MRTGSDDVGAMLDQPAAGGKDALPAFRRTRLDQQQHVAGQGPELVDQFRT
jgi:hypothetical protein